MLPLIALIVSPSWVLFSPITRQLNLGTKVYEDGYANAWAGPLSFNLDRAALRWGLPQSAFDDEGLASGISFAIHADFCNRLKPLFPENSQFDESLFGDMFMSCDELQNELRKSARKPQLEQR